MTPEIETYLKKIEQRLSGIEKRIAYNKEEVFLTAKKVEELYGFKKKTLQTMRNTGKLKKFQCLANGRGFRYLKDELDKLYTTA